MHPWNEALSTEGVNDGILFNISNLWDLPDPLDDGVCETTGLVMQLDSPISDVFADFAKERRGVGREQRDTLSGPCQTPGDSRATSALSHRPVVTQAVAKLPSGRETRKHRRVAVHSISDIYLPCTTVNVKKRESARTRFFERAVVYGFADNAYHLHLPVRCQTNRD